MERIEALKGKYIIVAIENTLMETSIEFQEEFDYTKRRSIKSIFKVLEKCEPKRMASLEPIRHSNEISEKDLWLAENRGKVNFDDVLWNAPAAYLENQDNEEDILLIRSKPMSIIGETEEALRIYCTHLLRIPKEEWSEVCYISSDIENLHTAKNLGLTVYHISNLIK